LRCIAVKIRGSFQPKKAVFFNPKTWGILVEKPGYRGEWSFFPTLGRSPTYSPHEQWGCSL